MKLVILMTLVAGSLAVPVSQSLTFHDDGSYQFFYETGKDGGSHTRSETRNPDGVVVGKFSYEDPTGEIREVNYRADTSGYVANGDVSVKGAPKGQFPVITEQASPAEETSPDATQEAAEDASSAAAAPEEEEQQAQPQEPEPTIVEAPQEEEGRDSEEIKDLALEESKADAPPEAFPEGFFLQHFHALRRLPEPTKEEAPATTEAPSEEQTSDVAEEQEDGTASQEDSTEEATAVADDDAKQSSADLFMPLKPFPNFSPQQWASSMYHQPVYVFSYQQPDSYGYHYFF